MTSQWDAAQASLSVSVAAQEPRTPPWFQPVAFCPLTRVQWYEAGYESEQGDWIPATRVVNRRRRPEHDRDGLVAFNMMEARDA